MSNKVVYARYDGDNAPGYITPGRLYEVSQEFGRRFNITNDMGRGIICLWGKCGHINGDNWTRVESRPAAAILREIADEAAVNPEPHLAFEQRLPDCSFPEQEWHAPPDLASLVASVEDMDMDVGWQVRRKPKTVYVEGEVLREAIDSAKRIVERDESGDDVTVARALLSLVEGE